MSPPSSITRAGEERDVVELMVVIINSKDEYYSINLCCWFSSSLVLFAKDKDDIAAIVGYKQFYYSIDDAGLQRKLVFIRLCYLHVCMGFQPRGVFVGSFITAGSLHCSSTVVNE